MSREVIKSDCAILRNNMAVRKLVKKFECVALGTPADHSLFKS